MRGEAWSGGGGTNSASSGWWSLPPIQFCSMRNPAKCDCAPTKSTCKSLRCCAVIDGAAAASWVAWGTVEIKAATCAALEPPFAPGSSLFWISSASLTF